MVLQSSLTSRKNVPVSAPQGHNFDLDTQIPARNAAKVIRGFVRVSGPRVSRVHKRGS